MRAALRMWPGAGPAILAVLLVARAVVADGLELSIALGIAAVFAGVAVVAARRMRMASVALLIPPIAFVASPARTELSFNLARPDDTGWYVFTLAVAVGVGLCLAGIVALLVDRPAGRWAVVPATLVGAVAFAGLIGLVDPQPDLGSGLDAATRDALPTVVMVNYAYGVEPVTVDGDRLRVRLENDSDLPHTFSVDALDLDVFVPAGRDAYVDVVIPPSVGGLDVYCAVGDHEALGMVVELAVG